MAGWIIYVTRTLVFVTARQDSIQLMAAKPALMDTLDRSVMVNNVYQVNIYFKFV